MTYIPRKCGVKFKPPTIVLIYEDESTKKTRQRLIPIRNFSRFSVPGEIKPKVREIGFKKNFEVKINANNWSPRALQAGSHIGMQVRDCSRAAEEIKNNPRHQVYLDGVSQQQLQKLFQLLRDNLNGVSLETSLEAFVRMNSINPEEDLNKLDDNELAKKKKIMDELFEKNRRKPNDPEFVYDLEVDFPQDGLIESCGWDEEEQDGEI